MSFDLPPSWSDALCEMLDAASLAQLRAFVDHEYATHEIYPPRELIFAAFDKCAFDDVKVVILGQDPYHGPGQAHGLSFSVPEGVRPPPSLNNIFKELESDLAQPTPPHGDLNRWARQGVLLLNATLTVRAHQAGSHQKKGWESFTDTVIRALAQRRVQIVYILWGAFAQKKAVLVDRERNLVIESAHPSPLSARRGFFGSKPFSRANAYLKSVGAAPIRW